MRILLITSRLPWPLDRGDRVRVYHVLRVLAKHHDVRLLSFVAAPEEERGAAELEKLGADVETVRLGRAASLVNMALAVPSRRPFQVAYYRSASMARRVAELARDRDVVIAHLIRTAPYLDRAPARARRVVDVCDCISSEYRASLPHRRGVDLLFYREEAKRVARYEREVVARVDDAWVISAAEADKLGGAPGLHVVPMGVHVPDPLPPRPAGPAPPRIVFTGNLGVPHNVDAARHLVQDVLPLVRRELPDAVVTLAGASPRPAVRALAGPGVEVTGWVDDLAALLRSADVFLAPMRYVAGVQTKILEAMANAVPVVTTEAARRGLGAESGTHVLTGSDPAELAAAAVTLVRQPDRARTLGDAGRAFVRARFSWETVLDRIEPRESAALS